MKMRWLALLSVICALVLRAPTADAEFRIESIDNDFPSEIQAATEEGKHLVVFFHQAGCPYCDKMRARVFPSKKIGDYYSSNFVMIDSNIRGNLDVVMHDGTLGTERDLAKKLRVGATPVFIFFDEKGDIALRTTGFLNVKLFYLAGKYVSEDVYKSKKSFFDLFRNRNDSRALSKSRVTGHRSGAFGAWIDWRCARPRCVRDPTADDQGSIAAN